MHVYLHVMFVATHKKGMSWGQHYMSGHRSQELLPLKMICLAMRVLHGEKYQKIFVFTFSTSLWKLPLK